MVEVGRGRVPSWTIFPMFDDATQDDNSIKAYSQPPLENNFFCMRLSRITYAHLSVSVTSC
jgi:hypothetical protein